MLTVTKKERPFAPTWRAPFESFRRDLSNFWEGLRGDNEWEWFDTMTPSLDMSETDNEIEVKLDLPGMKSDDISIQLNHNLLIVSGERKEEKEEKNKSYHRVERRSGFFSRTVTLPCEVKEEAVEAKYKDGVLTIALPKGETAKSKKIKIKG
ncbi:MAG: Hsp20/alpha crystallin family protein [Planctomycetes bacterium]|nr:Hsp20/alpha crystallin family protein [Planctomycetota bacterium]